MRARGIYCIDDLMGRCRVDDITGCWEWTGCYSGRNDGSAKAIVPATYVPALKRTTTCMRAAAFFTGREVRDDQIAWATCANRKCCNPDHIRVDSRMAWGKWVTAQKLIKDSPARSRASMARHRRDAPHMPALAAEIRASHETGRELAKRHGMSASAISRIRLGKTWRGTVVGASVFSLGPREK